MRQISIESFKCRHKIKFDDNYLRIGLNFIAIPFYLFHIFTFTFNLTIILEMCVADNLILSPI